MSIITAAFLGIIQGLTEFLPVSSSGHLVIAQHLFGIVTEQIFFDCVLHVGTLLVVVYYFRKNILELVGYWLKGTSQIKNNWQNVMWGEGQGKFTLTLLLSTFITGIIGIAGEDFLMSLFEKPLAVGAAFLITSVILITTRWSGKGRALEKIDLTWWHAVVLGVAQALAIVPGISRSGTTIAAALILGFKRELAVEYSFFLFLIIAPPATLKSYLDVTELVPAPQLLMGFLLAVISGYLALAFLVRLVKQGGFHHFAWYTTILGLWTLWYFGIHGG